jgi:hypothetical protein
MKCKSGYFHMQGQVYPPTKETMWLQRLFQRFLLSILKATPSSFNIKNDSSGLLAFAQKPHIQARGKIRNNLAMEKTGNGWRWIRRC